ncbi:MAG: Guanosine-5'-triphosphate,3'-diphosphate pyrophosphatase [Pelotomaculum sp. PtaB.Bin104]|nr:MAG: Guanosine-5'-triphosphate,3'-diphosphate pyrophosphatase [Pelotomaculum sp. PtaB.Bin104]
MKRIAAIDIGTNSTRLLVADVSGGSIKPLETRLRNTRLGQGISGGVLTPAAMERTLDTIDYYQKVAALMGANVVIAAATSAVRDARNRDTFLSMARERLGLNIMVLSGEEEAFLSYQGVLSGLLLDRMLTVVVDVGGGSTELIWHKEGRLAYLSVNAGALRMTEAGANESQITAILGPALAKVRQSPVNGLVGVGGTITTLAAVDQGLSVYDPLHIHGYRLTASAVQHIISKLKSMDIEKRKNVPGLQPERADIIVAGVEIVKTIMEGLGQKQMLVSECSILSGLILEKSK